MLRIISKEIQSFAGKDTLTYIAVLNVEVTYGRYKKKMSLPINNLSRDEIITELKAVKEDSEAEMREWEKMEMEINL